ncbi:hypothetical protein Leryth_011866 [Lithospermum erythrorhizon]|nr:hypothetical protein Leryth_011866 [Lithospermum erythrorhizon]
MSQEDNKASGTEKSFYALFLFSVAIQGDLSRLEVLEAKCEMGLPATTNPRKIRFLDDEERILGIKLLAVIIGLRLGCASSFTNYTWEGVLKKSDAIQHAFSDIPKEERRDAIEALLHSIHRHSTGEVPSALHIVAQDQKIEYVKDQSCIQGARIVELENEVEHMKCLLVDARVEVMSSAVLEVVVLLESSDRVVLGVMLSVILLVIRISSVLDSNHRILRRSAE